MYSVHIKYISILICFSVLYITVYCIVVRALRTFGVHLEIDYYPLYCLLDVTRTLGELGLFSGFLCTKSPVALQVCHCDYHMPI